MFHPFRANVPSGETSDAAAVDAPQTPADIAAELLALREAARQHRRETFGLAGRVEQLHRSSDALHKLLHDGPGQNARVVTVSPPMTAGTVAKRLPRPAEETRHPWWPRADLPLQPMQPPPGTANLTLTTRHLTVRAFSMLGLRGGDLDHAVTTIAEDQRRAPQFKPLLLTDCPDFAAIVRRGYVAEFIAPADQGDGPGGLNQNRLGFLAAKWGIAEVVDRRNLRAPKLALPAPVLSKPVSKPEGKKGRAAIVAWDLGHNPAGRAMVLYDLLERDWDVELIGPLWSRFGGKIWGPIANSTRKVRGLPCQSLQDFWPAALALAASADYDLVVVSKPRAPALLLGALIKKARGCPLVLDIDDFELSFFKDETTASLEDAEMAAPEALREPFGELLTRVCSGVVGDADALVVSNVALRKRFGGMIVRHARDENAFNADRFDRKAARQAMGMSDDDFALVFVGTARTHKGVFDVARTLSEMDDKRFVLHLVGNIPDKRVRAELDKHRGARIVYHPDCAFEELPSKIVGADAVVLLQDTAHPISQYQIPAKVSDASAFGLPILVTDVPPLRDLAAQGLVQSIEAKSLAAELTALRADRDAGRDSHNRELVREAFEAELGFRVNRERLELAIDRAHSAGPGLPTSFARLIDVASHAFIALRQQSQPPFENTDHPVAVAKPGKTRRAPAASKPLDMVMFWKQNDSGIYGRRSDMLVKHLLASGRIGRILQFDAPMEVGEFTRHLGSDPGSAQSLVLCNTIASQYHQRDTARHQLRTFLWDRRGRKPVLPAIGRSLAEYPDYVASHMSIAGFRPEETLALVCPVVFDFPEIARRIPFRGIIGDLIDDQRKFEMSDAYRVKIIASYQNTLPLLDLTFTNCSPVADAFADLAADIRVVPNGTELPPEPAGPIHPLLANLPRPLAGYVGNLRDRIDWELLRDTARSMPDVSFAVVGGGARDRDLEIVAGIPNLTFTGVVPYDQVQACIQSFDVALVPHRRDALTARMNPLKIYNYFAAARPIVATEVENVDAGIKPFIRTAGSAPEFAAAIRLALSTPLKKTAAYEKVLAGITWERRAATIMDQIDAWLSTRN